MHPALRFYKLSYIDSQSLLPLLRDYTNPNDFDLIKRLIYSQMIEVYKKIERSSLQLEFQKYGLEKNFVILNLTYGQAISFYLFLTKYPIPQNDMYLLNVLQSIISEINSYLN